MYHSAHKTTIQSCAYVKSDTTSLGAEGYGEELECHQRNPETLKEKNKVETPSYNHCQKTCREAQSMYRNQAHLLW